MIVKRDHKVAGGKLLRVEVEYGEGKVLALRVDGDFFAHPEELFEAAEAELVGLPIEALADRARAAFGRSGLTLYGVGPDDIAETLKGALDAAQIS